MRERIGTEGEEGSPERVDVEERGEGLACLGDGKERGLVCKGQNVDKDFNREVQQVVTRPICLFHSLPPDTPTLAPTNSNQVCHQSHQSHHQHFDED